MTQAEDDYFTRQQASEAYTLLNNSMLTECFDEIERVYLLAFKQTVASQSEEREGIWRALNAVDEVKSQLTRYINEGKILELDKLREEQRRAHGVMDGSPDLSPGIA